MIIWSQAVHLSSYITQLVCHVLFITHSVNDWWWWLQWIAWSNQANEAFQCLLLHHCLCNQSLWYQITVEWFKQDKRSKRDHSYVVSFIQQATVDMIIWACEQVIGMMRLSYIMWSLLASEMIPMQWLCKTWIIWWDEMIWTYDHKQFIWDHA